MISVRTEAAIREQARVEFRAEIDALCNELDVARDLLRSVIDKPLCWYEDIVEYLEAVEG